MCVREHLQRGGRIGCTDAEKMVLIVSFLQFHFQLVQ
jgi:hypothetical protein